MGASLENKSFRLEVRRYFQRHISEIVESHAPKVAIFTASPFRPLRYGYLADPTQEYERHELCYH